MEFVSGRSNFALTVFVPFDCSNNCPFCTTKKLYKDLPDPQTCIEEIEELLTKANTSPEIKDVVFTGGEPMGDIAVLKKFCKLVSKKNVYINTSLIKSNFFEFVKMVNSTDNIKGVSVSRHSDNANEIPCDVVEDWCLEAFEKPIRINVVIPSDYTDIKDFIMFIENVLNRWAGQNVTVNFREDFRFVTPENLHTTSNDKVLALLQNYEYLSHSYCEVCDTLHFNNPANMKGFSYHRGLEHSSQNMRVKTIVSDAIFLPSKNGYVLAYDWDSQTSPDFEKFLFPNNDKGKTTKRRTPPTKRARASVEPTVSSVTAVGHVCGFSSGGRCG